MIIFLVGVLTGSVASTLAAVMSGLLREGGIIGKRLEQASQDIRDHPAPRDWVAEALDRNTLARQRNTKAHDDAR